MPCYTLTHPQETSFATQKTSTSVSAQDASPREPSTFTSHSLRGAVATHLLKQSLPVHWAQTRGGWQDTATYRSTGRTKTSIGNKPGHYPEEGAKGRDCASSLTLGHGQCRTDRQRDNAEIVPGAMVPRMPRNCSIPYEATYNFADCGTMCHVRCLARKDTRLDKLLHLPGCLSSLPVLHTNPLCFCQNNLQEQKEH